MAILYQTEDIIKNQYRINGILGKGGVAVTYRAIDLETNSPVAIKAIIHRNTKPNNLIRSDNSPKNETKTPIKTRDFFTRQQ